jgi:Tol biopolymer transport system component
VEDVERTDAEQTAAAHFDTSADGTLVYIPWRGQTGGRRRSLVWVDRQGHEEPLNAPLRAYRYPRVSPDGTRLALDIVEERDIWIWHLTAQTLTRLTLDPAFDLAPVWTPDSQRILFSSDRSGVQNVFSQAADGTGSVERLTESQMVQFPNAIAPDAKNVVIREDAQENSDLLLLKVGLNDVGIQIC